MTEARRWITLACIVAALIFVGLAFAWCAEGRRDNRDTQRTEAATGKALDSVTAETPIIRQEQQEKQREVDRIEGSDERLPDGFGAELERVRRGEQRRNP